MIGCRNQHDAGCCDGARAQAAEYVQTPNLRPCAWTKSASAFMPEGNRAGSAMICPVVLSRPTCQQSAIKNMDGQHEHSHQKYFRVRTREGEGFLSCTPSMLMYSYPAARIPFAFIATATALTSFSSMLQWKKFWSAKKRFQQ